MNKKACIILSTLIPLTVANSGADGEQWEPSKLSEKTWDQVHQAKSAYDVCLNQQLVKNITSDADPRAVTDAILKACEEQLNPIRTAFVAEKVPSEMIDRYLRQQRSRAAQSVVREVMGAQAVRQSPTAADQAAP